MNKRVKELRKELNMTQKAFADAINVSKSAIEAYEYRDVTMSDRTVKDICRVFHVNEDWLRTGAGDMFMAPTRETEIAEITATMFNAEDIDYRYQLMRILNQVSNEDMETLYNVAKVWVDEVTAAECAENED